MVQYFPPTAVKCLDCDYTDLESKFVSQNEKGSVQLNYPH